MFYMNFLSIFFLFFRVHRHLLVMFARGVEPLFDNGEEEEEVVSRNESFGSNNDVIDKGAEQLLPQST